MALLKLAALGTLGYVGYKYYEKNKHTGPAAFDDSQADSPGHAKVRDAGPESMRDKPTEWSKADAESDESFPASDPPGNY